MMATCRSCGAEVIWVITARSKRMPLSVESGHLRFVLKPHDDIFSSDPFAEAVPTYLSHFADCPNADQHRKTR